MSAQSAVWNDFEATLVYLRGMTVAALKAVITGLAEESIANISKTGRKSELQERIIRNLRTVQAEAKVDRWLRARGIIIQARVTSEYDRNSVSAYMGAGPTYPATSSVPKYAQPQPGPNPLAQTYANSSNRASISSLPSRQGVLTQPRWKVSPFYRIDQSVSQLIECPESASSTDRRSQRFNFYLQPEHLSKLQSREPKYQLRLYCTTSQYYITAGTSFRNSLCPVEFPPTCEVRINSELLTANFRGIKKKAGTAPPADITTLARKSGPGVGNQVEIIYVNSTTPIANKKYYLVVNLVEVTSVAQLVDKMRNKIEDKEVVINRLKSQRSDDDEVQAGPTKMSLRDPLSYTRLSLPCRASTCVHLQCFDVHRWFEMMEQTTSWLCPICDRVLDVNELIVDGYVSDILASVSEEEDDVMVEPDGEWHTENGRYGSAGWIEKHGRSAPSREVEIKSEPNLSSADGQDGPAILVEDSSDDDERGVKRDSSSSFMSVPPPSAIIDLTLSDSDEEPASTPLTSGSRSRPVQPAQVLGKRKQTSESEFATGSSRRTSTAPSNKSIRLDGQEVSNHGERYGPTGSAQANRTSISHINPISPLPRIANPSHSPVTMHSPMISLPSPAAGPYQSPPENPYRGYNLHSPAGALDSPVLPHSHSSHAPLPPPVRQRSPRGSRGYHHHYTSSSGSRYEWSQ